MDSESELIKKSSTPSDTFVSKLQPTGAKASSGSNMLITITSAPLLVAPPLKSHLVINPFFNHLLTQNLLSHQFNLWSTHFTIFWTRAALHRTSQQNKRVADFKRPPAPILIWWTSLAVIQRHFPTRKLTSIHSSIPPYEQFLNP